MNVQQNIARPRIGIALLGKGATNHLHRPEVVEAFQRRGAEVVFIVREDYAALLEKIPACTYTTCHFVKPQGWRAKLLGWCQYVRRIYPSNDKGVRDFHRRLARAYGMKQRVIHEILSLPARFRVMMRAIVSMEALLHHAKSVVGLEVTAFDQLLILGIGIFGTELEGSLSWWARRQGVPVIHIAGNYDNLSSKGFRGVPVKRILVWGESMYQEAVKVQGIRPKRVTKIGAVRYNNIANRRHGNREGVLRSWGLDPKQKVILFAGAMSEFHYFEILAAIKEMRSKDENIQLIIRVYPDKALMNSVYMGPLLTEAEKTRGVYVSLADPNYREGARDREVLQIEEEELWNALEYSDVVVNIYSTIALEACVFDKPVINMWYFRWLGKMWARPPLLKGYPNMIHHRRIAKYGAIVTALDREQLITEIESALKAPEKKRVQRAEVVRSECGVIDGGATERLAEQCFAALNSKDCGGSLIDATV